MKKIQKRDGSIEDFDMAKVARVVHAAGLNEPASEALALKINQWIAAQTTDIIPSLVVRDQVQKELDTISPYASGLFRWYEKTKETP